MKNLINCETIESVAILAKLELSEEERKAEKQYMVSQETHEIQNMCLAVRQGAPSDNQDHFAGEQE